MKWKDKLLSDLLSVLESEVLGKAYVSHINESDVNIHLAIFTDPFLSYLLDGLKTFESRLSINKIAPYGKVYKNDIVIVKKSGGEILGIFTVNSVCYYSNLNPSLIKTIDDTYGERIMWNASEFLASKSSSNFLTLIEVSDLRIFMPFEIMKKDRGSWVLIRRGLRDTLFKKNDL